MPSLLAVEGPCVQLDQAPRQGEPDPHALARLVVGRGTLREEIENGCELRGGDADAIVGHRGDDVVAIGLGFDRDPAAAGGVARGIGEQVGEDLGQPGRVGMKHRITIRQPQLHLMVPRLDRGLRGLERARDHGAKSHLLATKLEGAAGDAAYVEQVVQQHRHVAALPVDDLVAEGGLDGGRAFRLEEVHRVPDRRQRIAKLVRQHRDVVVLAPVGFPKGPFQLLVLGDVHADAAHHERRSVRHPGSRARGRAASTTPPSGCRCSGIRREKTARPRPALHRAARAPARDLPDARSRSPAPG